MPEIFAVEAGRVGDSSKELPKRRVCGDECSKDMCNRWSCREKAGSSAREIGCVERVVRGSSGEVNEVTPGWERVRVQIHSGAIDTVGPREVAQAFELKETAMSKRGVGFVAANGGSIKNYGEKKMVG